MVGLLKVLVLGLLAMLVAILAFAAGFGTNYFLTMQVQPPAPVEVPAKFGLMWESWRNIKGQFYGDVPGQQQLVRGMIRGMLTALEDPHSVLVEPQPAQLEANNLQGNYGGIGAEVEAQRSLIVLLPFPEGPAARAGILPNDQIVEIDGKPLEMNATPESVETQLRGEVGSKVALVLHRIGATEEIKVELTRELINIPTVKHRMIENTSYGYIQVTLESADTASEFQKALAALKSSNAQGIVLDLRNNPGGLFPDPALEIVGEFLPANSPVVVERYRDGTEKTYTARGSGAARNLPFVVLVNSGTASAAEIMAGAFQDSGKTKLLGERTFGKGSVQGLFTLQDKSVLHLTTAKWVTPKGTEIDGAGLKPDIAVPLTPEDAAAGRDPQLDRAIEYLKNGS